MKTTEVAPLNTAPNALDVVPDTWAVPDVMDATELPVAGPVVKP